MGINQIFQVKELVNIKTIVEYYGFKINSNNKIKCCFHSEKTESLHVDSQRNRFFCFGCNKQGDAIDFVAKFFGLSIIDSCKKISEDFNLNIFSSNLSLDEKIRIKRKIMKQNKEKTRRENIQELKNMYFHNFALYDNICIHRLEKNEERDSIWLFANEQRVLWWEKYFAMEE